MYGRRGFTIIEVLVVIAIITLILSILIPSIKYARETARNQLCKVNIKNVCYAVTLYYDSYKKIPLPNSIVMDVLNGDMSLYDLLTPYLESRPPNTKEIVSPWACPSDPAMYQYLGTSYYYYPKMIYDSLCGPNVWPPSIRRNLEQLVFSRPKVTIYMDAMPSHGNYFNAGYFDCSVESTPFVSFFSP